jgi:WD40 repeat protein
MASGACLRTLEGHTGYVTCVALSADGKTLVSGSGDNTLR